MAFVSKDLLIPLTPASISPDLLKREETAEAERAEERRKPKPRKP